MRPTPPITGVGKMFLLFVPLFNSIVCVFSLGVSIIVVRNVVIIY